MNKTLCALVMGLALAGCNKPQQMPTGPEISANYEQESYEQETKSYKFQLIESIPTTQKGIETKQRLNTKMGKLVRTMIEFDATLQGIQPEYILKSIDTNNDYIITNKEYDAYCKRD